MKKGFINYEPREFIEAEQYDTWMSRGFPRAGDILFTTEAPLGHVAQFPSSGKFAIAQRLICLQPNEEIHARFLLHYMLSPEFQIELRRKATGSTAKGIRASELKKIAVRIPPLEEQKRIAAILDKADEINSNSKLCSKKRHSFLSSVFLFIFGDPRVSGKFERKKLSDVAEIVTGSTPSTNRSEYYGGDVPFVKPPDLHGQVIYKTINSLTPEGMSKGRLVPKKSVMVSCIGILGKTAIAGKNLCTNQQINSLIFDEQKIRPLFGFHFCSFLQENIIIAPKNKRDVLIKIFIMCNLEMQFR